MTPFIAAYCAFRSVRSVIVSAESSLGYVNKVVLLFVLSFRLVLLLFLMLFCNRRTSPEARTTVACSCCCGCSVVVVADEDDDDDDDDDETNNARMRRSRLFRLGFVVSDCHD